jgi:hypothetical protein
MSDIRTERSKDVVLLDEVARNERTIHHKKFGGVKFSRPTPRKERLIADVRRMQSNSDLRDPDVFTRDEIEKRYVERGAWSKEKSARMEELTFDVLRMMGQLEGSGYDSVEAVLIDYQTLHLKLLSKMEPGSASAEAVNRYFDMKTEPTYEDRKLILEAATSTEVDDFLEEADLRRTQYDYLNLLADTRKELKELRRAQERMFVDSLESRADRAEEMASLYYCAVSADTGNPLWPTFESMWDEDPQVLAELIMELYYFTHGVDEEMRGFLGKHGIIPRESGNVTRATSGDLPETPLPNSDGESLPSEQTSSSEDSE